MTILSELETLTAGAYNALSASAKGSVDIAGDVKDFNLSITCDDGVAPNNWTTLSVSAKSGTNPKLEVTKDGYVVSGDALSKINVYAEDGENARELSLSPKGRNVLLTDEGNNFCAKADDNGDGIYESILKNGKEADTIWTGGSGIEINFLLIAIIVGVILLCAAVTLVVILILKKKKKKPDNDGFTFGA